jgi:response regulator RpfG family c-di-GMP phosphodiesterase
MQVDVIMLRADVYPTCYEVTSAPQTEAIPVIMLTCVGHALNMKLSRLMGAKGHFANLFSLKLLSAIRDSGR